MPSISRPAAVTSWTFAPMPFSARGGAVEMTGQIPLSDNIFTTTAPPLPQNPIFHYKSTEGLPPPFRRPTPPIQREKRKTLRCTAVVDSKNCPNSSLVSMPFVL